MTSPLCPPCSAQRLLQPCSCPAFGASTRWTSKVSTRAMPTLTRAFDAKRTSSRESSSRVPVSPAGGACRRRGGRASVPTMASSRKALPPQRVRVDLAGPRKLARAGRALYLIVSKDDATRVGCPQGQERYRRVSQRSRNSYDNRRGEVVECFRTDSGTGFVNAARETVQGKQKPT